jgi:hypothetical protein
MGNTNRMRTRNLWSVVDSLHELEIKQIILSLLVT